MTSAAKATALAAGVTGAAQATALALALVAAASCRRDSGPVPDGTPGAVPARPSGAAAPARPGPRRSDPLWRRAAGDDPLEHARLAEAEGAAGLLAALDDGGEVAETALRALPYAEDGEIALQPLAARALNAPPVSLRPLLQAILEVAARPARPREALAPEGAPAAARAVLELSRRRELPSEIRALAISAARACAEHGYLDGAAIPVDLDPAADAGSGL